MPTETLEKRLTKVENELADLKAEVRKPARRNAWLETLGRFENDPLFDKAMRLGQTYRERQPKC
jgi:hypothetical protein